MKQRHSSSSKIAFGEKPTGRSHAGKPERISVDAGWPTRASSVAMRSSVAASMFATITSAHCDRTALRRTNEHRHAHTFARNFNRIGIDVASNHAPRSHELRCIRQYARSRTHVQHSRTRLHVPFDGLQAKLRRRMPASSASHAGIDFQARSAHWSWRCLVPRSHQKEPLAHTQRRPGFSCNALPIGSRFFTILRGKFGETLQ